MRRRQNVVRRQHQRRGFDLRFGRQRNVDGHLIAVEIRVERGADQRVNLERFAFDQHGLESLDAEAVKRGSAVEQNRMVLDDLFEDVPNDGILLLDQFLGLLDGGAMAALFEPVIDERLEELERHLLRQTALVQLEIRTDDDDRTAGVIDALAEKVLAEAALLAFERIGERFERTVVGAAQHAAAAAVVEQRVDRFLQHALFVADDHVRRMQFHQLLQTVVAVDDAAIEIVEIGGRETAAIERHQRTQFRRNHRQHVEDHPLRLVAGFAEAFDHAQTLGELQLLLLRSFRLHPFANVFAEEFDVDLLEQFFDAFGAHHGDELTGGCRILLELPFALVGNHFALGKIRHFARIDHDVGFEIKHALEFTQCDVEQVADARRQAFEEPHMRAGAGQFDMAEAFPADTRQRDFDAALVADDAAMLHPLVFAAETFPVRDGSEDPCAEQAVPFRLESPVIDGFRLWLLHRGSSFGSSRAKPERSG